eukprot:231629_1
MYTRCHQFLNHIVWHASIFLNTVSDFHFKQKMEFADIGAHCHYDLCQQQTYLPFNCDSCQHKFCKLHRAQKSHECPNLSKEINEAKQIEKQKIKQNKKTGVNKPIHKCDYKKCKKRER